MMFTILSAVWSKKVNIVVMWWKSILTKSLWWLKKDDKDFENSTKCWICDNVCFDGDIKVRSL